jgi:uncharacterized protein DUF1844
MGDPTDKGGFTVTDRRSFSDTGEARPKEAVAPPPAEAPGPGAPAPDGAPTLPAVDFHTFVLSLGSSALLHLGELEHPDVGAPQKDLPLAKHTIDILVMLEEKTRGNLTAAEEKLIASLLYDLRLRYVEAQK